MSDANGTNGHSQALAPVIRTDQLALLKDTICKGSSDSEFQLFVQICNRVRLDPFARQIYSIARYDKKLGREVRQTQTSIDGFRVIAERSHEYEGQTKPEWCGKDGVWRDVWLEDVAPFAARVGVYRKNCREAFWGVARFDAYAQAKDGGGLTYMWSKMGDNQIAKCAEALALRKAFPQDLSGLYTTDEMAQEDNEPVIVARPADAATSTVQTTRLLAEALADMDAAKTEAELAAVQGKASKLSAAEKKVAAEIYKKNAARLGVAPKTKTNGQPPRHPSAGVG